MVIGCTDGIGKEYARYLRQLGVPLILVGRNLSKL
jgi:short-subunit dehydrogenase